MVGAATAATLQVVVPRSWLLAVADQPLLAVGALGGLAVVLAICSEADAFVAAAAEVTGGRVLRVVARPVP